MHSAVCAPSALLLSFSFFYCTRAHRDLHSFPTRRSSDLGRVIDATGKVVVPGGIDPHTHLAHPIMSHPDEPGRSEEHTSELQSHSDLVCRLLLEKKKHRITGTQ